MSKHLTDYERLHIVEEYPDSKYAIEKKYNIAQGLIKHWLRKIGPEDKNPSGTNDESKPSSQERFDTQ